MRARVARALAGEVGREARLGIDGDARVEAAVLAFDDVQEPAHDRFSPGLDIAQCIVEKHGMNARKKWLAAALIAGASVPVLAAPESYTVDPNHTYPSLEMSHMGISVWRGKFNKSSGKVTLDRAAGTGTVEIRVDTMSIDFGHMGMNTFAVGEDWLGVDRYPTMSYKGAIRFTGDKPTSVEGQLTLREVTRPLKLRIDKFGCIPHPLFRKEVCGADAEGDLNRAEFGMTLYSDGDAGKIHLRIQVEAIKD